MDMLIKLGGLYHIGLIIFHLLFSRLFDWETDLRKLRYVNSGIMRVMNLCLILVFAIFCYLSFIHTQDLLNSPLGHSVLALIALFWLVRRLNRFFFKLKHWVSVMLLIIFLSGSTLYAVPVWQIFSRI